MAELGLEGVSGLAGMPMNSYDKILILNNNMALCNFDTNICKWFDVQCPRVFLCCFWFFFFLAAWNAQQFCCCSKSCLILQLSLLNLLLELTVPSNFSCSVLFKS